MPESAPASAARCPYCTAPFEGGGACAFCGSRFPWADEIAELRNQLKEREVGRLRATTTLVEEVFQSWRTGRPVSLSALKGFVGAWLFPRALIVVGSVVGGLVLLAQTIILYNQTKLLDVQARAAQIEQEGKLRDRVVAMQTIVTLWPVLEKTVGMQLRPPSCLPACSDLATLADERPKMWEALLPATAYAKSVVETHRQFFARIIRGRFGADKEFSVNSMVAFASHVSAMCALDPAETESLMFKVSGFYSTLDAMSRTFGPNANAEEMKKLVESILADLRFGPPSTLKVERLYEELRSGQSSILVATGKLRKACESVLEADQASLRLMRPEPSVRPQ